MCTDLSKHLDRDHQSWQLRLSCKHAQTVHIVQDWVGQPYFNFPRTASLVSLKCSPSTLTCKRTPLLNCRPPLCLYLAHLHSSTLFASNFPVLCFRPSRKETLNLTLREPLRSIEHSLSVYCGSSLHILCNLGWIFFLTSVLPDVKLLHQILPNLLRKSHTCVFLLKCPFHLQS